MSTLLTCTDEIDTPIVRTLICWKAGGRGRTTADEAMVRPICNPCAVLLTQPQGWSTSQLVSAAQLMVLSQLFEPPLLAM